MKYFGLCKYISPNPLNGNLFCANSIYKNDMCRKHYTFFEKNKKETLQCNLENLKCHETNNYHSISLTPKHSIYNFTNKHNITIHLLNFNNKENISFYSIWSIKNNVQFQNTILFDKTKFETLGYFMDCYFSDVFSIMDVSNMVQIYNTCMKKCDKLY